MGGELESKSPGCRVLIVDEHVSVRQMVGELVLRDGPPAVTSEAATGFEGLRLFRRVRPNLIISALTLPEMNGVEMIRHLREEEPSARVLFYSGSRNRELTLAALSTQPHGFVHKTDSLATLREAVNAVRRGFGFFSPFATRLLDEARGNGSAESLTQKERTVLQLVAEGMSSKQVAGRLSLSPKTIEHYRTQLMQKLGLRDVASLTRYAMRCGLVE